MGIKAALIAGGLMLACSAAAAVEAETCEKPSAAGIKRCVHAFSGTGSGMKTIVHYDRAKDIVDWEINFPVGIDSVYPTALIGATMALLDPASTKDSRSGLLKKLMANAGGGGTEFIASGNYEWTSAKLPPDLVMIRATSLRKPAAKGGGVTIGMSAEQVLRSNWGKPKSVNTTITAGGRHEQWVYGSSYLYLDNGVLTSIQTSKR